MKSYLASLPRLLPIASAWAEKQEALALEHGRPLGEAQLEDAVRAGMAHPGKIRVMRLEALPQPEHEEVMFMARQIGLFSPNSTGLTLGYAIHLRPDVWNDRYVLVHECVHVGQYEKKNGISAFLADYLRECLDPGFPFGMLEKEAIYVARHICNKSSDVRHLRSTAT